MINSTLLVYVKIFLNYPIKEKLYEDNTLLILYRLGPPVTTLIKIMLTILADGVEEFLFYICTAVSL